MRVDPAEEVASYLPALPIWEGADLERSDPGFQWFAARAHARELLAAYDVGFDRYGKPYVDMAGRVRRPMRRVLYRGRSCGVRLVSGLKGVSLFQRPDRGLGRVSGVCACGGSMTCPVCAPRISAKRAGKIMEGAKVAGVVGLPMTMETYTLSHHFGNVLADEVAVWKEAFKLAFSGKYAAEVRKLRLGFVNAAEVTFGGHGWHFHRHLLTFWKDNPRPDLLEDCWRSAARHVGRYTSDFEGHAFNSRAVTGHEDYVAKIGWELSNPQAKSSRTPLRLLLDDMQGDRAAGANYIEAVVALTSHKVGSVRWSPLTTRKLGLPDEKTDEQLSNEEAEETDVLLGSLSEWQWQRVIQKRIEFQLLAAAQEGETAVNALLDSNGVHHLKRPDRWCPAAAPDHQNQGQLEGILRNEYQ